MLLFIQFIYYSFVRPAELRRLKIKNIQDGKMLIEAYESKGGRGEYVRIPPPLEKLIQEYKLREYDPEHFVFSHGGRPGEKGVGRNYFYRKHVKVLKTCKIQGKYTTYGHKHSGVIELFKLVTDYSQIQVIQQQCRHKTLDQTFGYLRDLGMVYQSTSDILEIFTEF